MLHPNYRCFYRNLTMTSIKIILIMKKTILLLAFFNFSLVFGQKNVLNQNGHIDFKNPFFEHMNYMGPGSYSFYSKKINLQQVDSLLFFTYSNSNAANSYYISDHEVTNNEYRAFVNWVRDSISRVKIYQRSSLNDQAKWVNISAHPLANYGKNGERYFLNWNTPLDYAKPEIDTLLKDMYFDSDQRFYNRKELDVRYLNFRYYDQDSITNLINVYPDTLAFSRELNYMDMSVAQNYFWHPAYGSYPVVGISYDQAKAYCIWYTKMYQAALPDNPQKNKDLLPVVFRLPTPEEWMLAASKGPYPLGDSYQSDKKGFYYANYGQSRLSSGLIFKRSFDDGAQYQAPAYSYQPNVFGLFNLYGNVGEWLDSQPKLGDFYADYLGLSENNIYSADSLQNIPIYITDPSTEQTLKVIKGSIAHRQLAQRRFASYAVDPNDSFEQVLQKYKALYSIGQKYKDSVMAVHNYKKNIEHWYTHEFEELYNFQTGSYFIHENRGSKNYEQLENAYNAYQQNKSALFRLEEAYKRRELEFDITGVSTQMVAGGSWLDEAHYLEKGIVKIFPSYYTSSTIGFRIAADAVGSQIPKKDQKRIKKNKPKKSASGWDITDMDINDLK